MAVDDSYTKILLHMDGANLSTTFTDEAGDTWAPHGTAAIYTSYYVFGGAAGGFDGTGAYVTSTASHPAGTGNFVIDFWLNMASATQKARGVFSNRRNAGGSSAEWVVIVGDTNNCLSFHTGAAAIIDDTTHPLSQDTWYHIAFIRSGNTLYYAKDGSIITSASLTSDLSGTQSFSMAGNDVFATGFLFGRIDELRLSLGTDRGWSSGFTPPTSAYAPKTFIPRPIFF